MPVTDSLEQWRANARKAYEADRLAEVREKILSELRESGLTATGRFTSPDPAFEEFPKEGDQ